MNKETLEKLYNEGGAQLVAKNLGASVGTAYKFLKEAKIILNRRKKNSGRKKKFTLEI